MSPEERAKLQTHAMQEELDLNALQRTDVYAINLKYAKQAQPRIEQSGRKQRKKTADEKTPAAKKRTTQNRINPRAVRTIRAKKARSMIIGIIEMPIIGGIAGIFFTTSAFETGGHENEQHEAADEGSGPLAARVSTPPVRAHRTQGQEKSHR